MIEISHLKKSYNKSKQPILDDINLKIESGEFITLVGTSGCGKTTLLKTINQLVKQDSGNIYIEGQDVSKVKAEHLRRHMGYVIQKIGLFDHLTIGENIAIVPEILKWAEDQINERVDAMLGLVNLDPDQYRDRYPHELSGGQQQRVGIARALAADPDILLMDEPFGAIDAINRDYLQDQLLRIQQRTQKTIVFVTHDLDEAFKLGSRILIMNQGRIQQFGTAWEILKRPANSFVENFVNHDGALRFLKFIEARQLMRPVEEAERHVSQRLNATTKADALLMHMLGSGRHEVILEDDQHTEVGVVSYSDFANLAC